MSLDEGSKIGRKADRGEKKVTKSAPKVEKAKPAAPVARPSSSTGSKGSGILSRVGTGPSSVGTMVVFRNLDFKVSDRDMRELASTVGEIVSGHIVLGSSGRSSGMGEVVYVHKGDAMQAVKRFHNLTFDGRPMDVSIAQGGGQQSKSSVFGSALSGSSRGGGPQFSVVLSDPAFNKPRREERRGPGDGRRVVVPPQQSARGGNGNGNGNGGKGGNNGKRGDKPREERGPKAKAPPTSDQLDAQLEAFLAGKGK